MSTMIYFDTLHYAQTLKEAGFSDKQTETLVKVQQESLSECLDTTLATKADMSTMKTELLEVKTELKAEIHEIKIDLKTLEAKVNAHGWMLGFLVAGMSALIVKTFF